MKIGLVGKPNVGKSTFFAAATETSVDIANYPFTTIDPNIGITYLPATLPCPCNEIRSKKEEEGRLEPTSPDDERSGSICTPNQGTCISHRRIVPMQLLDVAGLVPGASEGRGRGNQFLSDLARCDALIQVVDVAGATDMEGNPTEPGSCDPLEEHRFLIHELEMWLANILGDKWIRGTRKIQSEGVTALNEFLLDTLTGLGATAPMISEAMREFAPKLEEFDHVWKWGDTERHALTSIIRRHLFPLFVAANKADLVDEAAWSELSEVVEKEGGLLIPTSADSELALRRAAKAGFIHYTPGSKTFDLCDGCAETLNPAQKKGLEQLLDRLSKLGGTGIVELLTKITYDKLDRMVVYPVQDETHWTDGDGNILPDALVLKTDSNAKQMAFAVHTDLGEGFIKAIDGRTGRVLGGDSELSDGDVVKIHSKN